MMSCPACESRPHYQAAMFQFPGRPLSLARRLTVHNRVVHRLRRFMLDEGFHEIPVPDATAPAAADEHPGGPLPPPDGDPALTSRCGRLFLGGMIRRGFPAVWCESGSASCDWEVDHRHRAGAKLIEAERKDLSLTGLLDLLERLLQTVAADLSAELLGGRQVTRLDRMIHSDHPRLTYREALAILAGKGWSIPFGGDLHLGAAATLSRHCGNLPALVTHFPTGSRHAGSRADDDDPATCRSVAYILPYAGGGVDGGVRADAPERAGFGLSVARVLQYLMGLESVQDALIHPLAMTGGLGPVAGRRAAEASE